MADSLLNPLNESLNESIDPSRQIDPSKSKGVDPNMPSVNEVYTESIIDQESHIVQPKSTKKFKIITGVGVCVMILGLLMFLAFPPAIHSQIVKQAIDKSILSPDNENFWAHFPGDSNTIITRNYSFFNFTNQQDFFLYGKKPEFRQIQGYIITEYEDFVDIKYNEDMTKVSMKDWLHFQVHEDSRSLDQKQQIMNVPSLGYWFILKNARDPIIFIEGFSLLFTSIEDSIVDTVIGQGISSQYLSDYQTAYVQLLQPAGVDQQNAIFVWLDQAYGMNNKNNIKYWVQAATSSFNLKTPSFSQAALDLKDYFTLTDSQLYSILKTIISYADSLEGLIFQNHYCQNISACTGKQLSIRQLASSYVTFNTPPVSKITPTLTICTDNVTCNGSFPEISAYYQNVYMVEHPEADPGLSFDVDIVRKWVDYNPTGVHGEYSKHQAMLMHIGNLDALFANGTKHDQVKTDFYDSTQYLDNIRQRFGLTGDEDTRVFWQWIKYLSNSLLRQQTKTNQKLGISNTFSSSIFTSFSYLQDNLQNHILVKLVQNSLEQKQCHSFLEKSLETTDNATIDSICEYYQDNVQSQQFVQDSIKVCRNKYGLQWAQFKKMGATNINLESFCDSQLLGGFGQIYHIMRIRVNDFYNCNHTPTNYCSDYQLALKQWSNSTITKNILPQLKQTLSQSSSFNNWDRKSSKFEYGYYKTKFPDADFPVFSMDDAYQMFNFDHIFSATSNLKVFKDPATSELWRNYIRYVVVFVGFKGITNQRTAREYIFGYNDQYLLWRKNNYPPFGGDPSTPAYTAFNDLNITQEETVLEIELHTGKGNPIMTAQYNKINGLNYLTTNYSRFNGNETSWVLETPWAENDYFYGTNGKTFAPDQPNSKNVSIYVPNIQRYGSGSLNQSYPYQRYGYDLSIAYLGRYIYESGEEYPDNKKYYQNNFAIFNETSVLGFPFFMTKHHFMNCSANWSSYVRVFNEQGNIQYVETSLWDDSYVIVEPYTGVSFQSTLFLQANYYHEPDELFTYNQTSLLPVFAIYRSGNLTEEKANELFGPLTTALNVKVAFFYVGIVFTVIGLAVLVFGILKLKKIKKEEEDIKDKTSIKISMQPQVGVSKKYEPQRMTEEIEID